MRDARKMPEILAPAGGMESVIAAVRCGADGVYIGGGEFSARAFAENFSEERLFEAARYCHLHGVKIYRAMNVIIFDRELESFARQVKITAQAGFDGIIIQDAGGFAVAKEIVPDMPLHASTQMTLHTPLGVKAALGMGFCRTVPARELTLENISEICRAAAEMNGETEVFVHGAQCMCLSGQCYMSGVIGSRSANRGRCAQSCRLPVSALGERRDGGERYDLSLKDMSLIGHLGELAAAGVNSFKIEGRMKRPEYVAAAVTAVRHTLYGGGDRYEDMRRLEAVFSRSGFTDGYLTGKIGSPMFGSRTKEDVTAAESVLGELAALYKDEAKDAVLDFRLTVHEGERAKLDFVCANQKGGTVRGSVSGDIPEKAQRREFTFEEGLKNLSRLGGTRYVLGETEFDISPGLALSAACVNGLRRRAAEAADRMTAEANTPRYKINENYAVNINKNISGVSAEKPKTDYRIITRSADIALEMLGKSGVEFAVLPAEECGKLVGGNAADDGIFRRIIVSLPDIVTDEKGLLRRLGELCEKGFAHFFCGNFTHLGVLKALGSVYIHGGWGLGCANRKSLEMLYSMGFEDVCLSFEMKAGQIKAISRNSPLRTGIYAYGRLPLMTVRNCPVKAAAGSCKGCKGALSDRSGRVFPVSCGGDYARILNCDILQVCDKSGDFGEISFGLLDFTGLDPAAAKRALDECMSGEKPAGNYTRGLYYRGVI